MKPSTMQVLSDLLLLLLAVSLLAAENVCFTLIACMYYTLCGCLECKVFWKM